MSLYTVDHVALGELCVKIGSGVTPRGGSSVYVDGGTALIRSQNVYNSRFTTDGLAYISEAIAEKMKGVTVEEGDVLLNITGDSVARSCRIPPDILPARVNQHVAIIRTDRNRLDSGYLAHLLVSPRMQAKMLSWSGSGGTRKALTKGMIEGFEVPLPSLNTQAKIASTLSTYDDLIENNRRRIALLEEAARLLYKEWFVRFRFPGHENVKIIDGTPEGWEVKPVGEVISEHIGGGWGQDESLGSETEPAFVIRGTDIPQITVGDFSKIGLRFHKPSSLAKRILVQGDIVFEVSGGSTNQPVGRALLISDKNLNVFSEKVICASFCKRLSFGDEKLAAYIYRKLVEDRENGSLLVYQKESASALKNFNFQAFLEGYSIAVPPKNLLEEFVEHISVLSLQQATLTAQISASAKARDLLLPKLMSGEIAV